MKRYDAAMPEPKRQKFTFDIPVLVLTATILVGIISLLGFMSPMNLVQALCLMTAALAFGLASIALWRR